MKFTKMQGIGNDYIYVNCFEETVEDPSALAVRLSDRHYGVGSDGVILILPSEKADCRMDMYNADGSRGMMCGNGVRCVGKYVYERGIAVKNPLTVETLSGIKTLFLEINDGKVQSIEVDMGKPILRPERIPAVFSGSDVIARPLNVGGTEYKVTCISMGNPHCVVFMNEVDSLDLYKIGPMFENHPAFPQKVNTEFVQVLSREEVKMRVWERGSGETMACGTGACAVAVAGCLNGITGNSVLVHLNGGDLQIRWPDSDASVMMKGPAEFVFDGSVNF